MTIPTPFWRSIESLHHFIYFLPDARARYGAIGLKGSWMGYFASRSAALGTPSPELVVATFHGFAPRTVHRALPDAWGLASRDDILATRLDLARQALAGAITTDSAADTSHRLMEIVDGLDLAGKPLAAAHSSLPVPGDDLGRFWHAVTVIREFRGDCHVAVLVAAGIGGAEANVLAVAAGLTFAQQQQLRGWTDEEWAAAADRLRHRGWLDAEGAITEAGRDARTSLEDSTDRACAAGIDDPAATLAVSVTDDLVAAARALEASFAKA